MILIVFAVRNLIMTKMISMGIEYMMTFMTLMPFLLLINVNDVQPTTTPDFGVKITKRLDAKSFGLNKNYDIWDTDTDKRSKRGFFEETAANEDGMIRDDDVFSEDGVNLYKNLERNHTERRSKGMIRSWKTIFVIGSLSEDSDR